MRVDDRAADALRPVQITPNFLKHPAGSCLIEMGNTRLVCAAMFENSVPGWLKGSGRGWLSAEYSMLPASSDQRVRRDRNKISGRTQEIQRLIGRSLRSCVDMEKLGERSFMIDCDVLDADGGTRTAAITGGYVALALAIKRLSVDIPQLKEALVGSVAAVSTGIVKGESLLDIQYVEDSQADVDFNVVKTSEGKYIELQGTAEAAAFDRDQLSTLLELADKGINELMILQRQVVEA